MILLFYFPFLQQDGDANSCYFSASASHTDNYCSTDEHEPSIHHPPIVIHSSDSGADVSEKYYEKTHKMNTISEASISVSSPKHVRRISSVEDITFCHHERNNSLPDVFGREELNDVWEKFWSKNGERLIWSSWIEKYSDYINPDFNKSFLPQQTTPCDAGTNFSFDQKNIDQVLSGAVKSDTEIIISSSSPGVFSNNENNMFAEGWNPLSPSSIDETWTHNRLQYNREESDILLSPRCDSVTSSIPLTIGTTDSMTNVTRMTMSSYDMNSGKVSCESSQLSDLSSPESLFSSTSSSSKYEDVDDGPTTIIEDESAMDADQYWQILWQKHFQEQYARHFKLFMEENEPSKLALCSSVNSENFNLDLDFTASSSKPSTSDNCTNAGGGSSITVSSPMAAQAAQRNKRKKNKKVSQDNLPKLVAKLNLKNVTNRNSQDEAVPMQLDCIDGDNNDGNSKDTGKSDKSNEATSNCHINNSEIQTMSALGLPIRFGGSGSGGDKDKPPKDISINLKRRYVFLKFLSEKTLKSLDKVYHLFYELFCRTKIVLK